MGRLFLAIGKTVLVAVLVTGTVIASFYLAYLVLILIVIGIAGAVAWKFFNRPPPPVDWYRYEDSD